MRCPTRNKRREAAPAKPVCLLTRIASGLAAMAMTMAAMVVTLPPNDVTTAGRALVASSALLDRTTARA